MLGRVCVVVEVAVFVLPLCCPALSCPPLLQGPPTVLVPPLDRSVPFHVGWDYIEAILKEEDAGKYPCSGTVAGEVKVLCHLVKVQRYLLHPCWVACVHACTYGVVFVPSTAC